MTTDTATPLHKPVPRNISNSEVTAYLSCKRMYNFAFIDLLAPKDMSPHLARGEIGHLAFQRYVEERLKYNEGRWSQEAHDSSLVAGRNAFLEAANAGFSMEVIMQAKFLWERYMGFHNGWVKWRLLGTEQRHFVPITESLNMPIRYDLYYEDVDSGYCYILDFKFTYEFWTSEDHDVNGQMPKYITVMRANGFRVDGGKLEQIRTRSLGKEKASDPKALWRRTPYNPTPARSRTMLRQHVAASLQIERHRNLSPVAREDESIAVFNKFGACKFCNYKDLCNQKTEGIQDLSVMIREGYTVNDYATQQQKMDDLIT